jgi:hypothetical protein
LRPLSAISWYLPIKYRILSIRFFSNAYEVSLRVCHIEIRPHACNQTRARDYL